MKNALERLPPPNGGDEQSESSCASDESLDARQAAEEAGKSKKEALKFVRKENRIVWSLRVVVFIILAALAIGVCVNVYQQARDGEVDNFEEDFAYLGDKLLQSFSATLSQRMGVVDHFARDMISQVNHDPTMDWPFVTFPDFEYRAGSTCRLADLVNLVLAVRVESEEKEEWEEYSVANQGWRKEGLTIQGREATGNASYVHEEIRNISTVIKAPGPKKSPPINETREGPYLVAWQTYPVIYKPLAQMNLYNNSKHPSLTSVVKSGLPNLPRTIDYWGLNETVGRRKDFNLFLEQYEGLHYDGSPVVHFYYPVFDAIDPSQRTEVKAVLMGAIYWKTYFANSLPEGRSGLTVILHNTCNQSYTYNVHGSGADFIGHGDLHDPKYEHLEMGMDAIDINVGGFDGQSDSSTCQYSLRVFPSDELREYYTSEQPLRHTQRIAIMFIITSAVFLLYDYCVERRQRIVSRKARQAGAVVSELFPEEVRQRLYDERSATVKRSTACHAEDHKPDDKAIARLHPECTILFADIAGFTQWSSSRSPVQVFELLETIYGAFDIIAKKRHVFKVETIGDCYVAATGLPQAQEDHAIIMAKFASHCLKKLQDLIAQGDLVEKLGPDTAELAMRVGLHSGPVTAGVLKGMKSRFQIFGDTVNTAACMESNGLKGKIQVSQSTADLLTQGGKSGWLHKRDTLVAAKGKGDMQTYWVESDGSLAHSTFTSDTGETTDHGGLCIPVPAIPTKIAEVSEDSGPFPKPPKLQQHVSLDRIRFM